MPFSNECVCLIWKWTWFPYVKRIIFIHERHFDLLLDIRLIQLNCRSIRIFWLGISTWKTLEKTLKTKSGPKIPSFSPTPPPPPFYRRHVWAKSPQQILPAGLWSFENPQAAQGRQVAAVGATCHGTFQHAMQHVRRIHRQSQEVQHEERESRRRGLFGAYDIPFLFEGKRERCLISWLILPNW